MLEFPDSAVCVIGISKTGCQNPITFVYQSLIGVFIADQNTGIIYDVQFNTICGITNEFLSELFIGLSLFEDLDTMQEIIKHRYLGDSRKAIMVIIRDASAKLYEKQKADVDRKI